MSGVLESASIATEITAEVPEDKLSSFSWACLAYAWSGVISREFVASHPHRKEFFKAVDLGRKIQELSAASSATRKARGKTGKQFVREIIDESTSVIRSLRRKGVGEPWLDWEGSNEEDYVSHIALVTATAIRSLAIAFKQHRETDSFEEFHSIAQLSSLAIAYSIHFAPGEVPVIKIVAMHAEKLADDGYAGRLGRPVPKRLIRSLVRQPANLASRTVIEVQPVDWIVPRNARLLGIALATLLVVVGVLAQPGSRAIGVVLILVSGLLVSLMLLSRSRDWRVSKYVRVAYIVGAVLFFMEAAYLAMVGTGIIP